MENIEELVSDEQIKKSYWLVTHLMKIKRMARNAVIGVMMIWWLAIVSYAFIIFIVQRDADRLLRGALIQQTGVFGAPLIHSYITIEQVGALAESGQSADFYALFKNSNTEWSVVFTYRFISAGHVFVERSSFLLPGEQKYAFLLAQNGIGEQTIDVQITSQKWNRITMQDKRLINERNRFSVSDVIYTPAKQTGAELTVPVSSVSFTVKNESPFYFSEVVVPVVALSDITPVGVAQIPFYNVKPEEKRTGVIKWFHSFAQPTSFDIRPAADILDLRL